ncbi:hypothetical protein B0H11DRAFT_1942251 [Mycena galericulata]|nr:hypothetical protein B0H11DRAFT_1942251 [Mycena galericulata]
MPLIGLCLDPYWTLKVLFLTVLTYSGQSHAQGLPSMEANDSSASQDPLKSGAQRRPTARRQLHAWEDAGNPVDSAGMPRVATDGLRILLWWQCWGEFRKEECTYIGPWVEEQFRGLPPIESGAAAGARRRPLVWEDADVPADSA